MTTCNTGLAECLLRYEERLFKKIDRRILTRSFWQSLYKAHTQYRSKPLYVLGASSFNRLDSSLIFAYPRKVFKWGYFTSVRDLDVSELLQKRDESHSKCISILWCGTIAQVKRPDLVPKLAKRLLDSGYDFKIDMIGTGGLKQELEKQIEVTGVENNIRLLGNMPNSQVLSLMQQHHIFIFTSDYGEGWGAVLNEAMSNGCAVVCSDKVGASRFLIKDGWNGLLFKSGSDKDLYIKVRRYIDDRLLMKSCALNAYKTMSTIWSPKNAALNFLSLCNSLLTNSPVTIEEGPCSIAKMIW